MCSLYLKIFFVSSIAVLSLFTEDWKKEPKFKNTAVKETFAEDNNASESQVQVKQLSKI